MANFRGLASGLERGRRIRDEGRRTSEIEKRTDIYQQGEDRAKKAQADREERAKRAQERK